MSGSCKPNIDFNSYNLFIGKKALPSGNNSIQYDIQKLQGTKKLNIKITFYQNGAAVALNITYHILLPKGYEINKVTTIETIP